MVSIIENDEEKKTDWLVRIYILQCFQDNLIVSSL